MAPGTQETDDLKPRNVNPMYDMDNLIDLPHLNEPEILMSLKIRFEKSVIFTYTGPVLLTINPTNVITPSKQCDKMMQKFVQQIRTGVTDGIAAAVAAANNGTINKESIAKHSILIGGESGSGKSETLKMILKAFRVYNESSEKISTWYDNLLVSNRVLESFGNARTATTPNSSRFAKLVELVFDPSGNLVGSSIRTYLLESARTSSQQSGERNFNIFYELIAGLSPQEKKNLQIKPDEKYYYTSQGQAAGEDGDEDDLAAEKSRDSKNFATFRKSLKKLGFDQATIEDLLKLVAAVLTMGEIKFRDDLSDNSGGCVVIDDNDGYRPLDIAADLMGLSPAALNTLITSKSISTGRGEILNRRLSTAQAVIARDAVVRAMYKNMFEWLAASINHKLNTEASNLSIHHTNSVILVDIFGFDSFAHNSLEQLCINYANEALQQVFNYHIFKLEMELYQKEQLSFDDTDGDFIRFSDNKENMDLIGNGIFRILDDQCRIPNPTDKRFVAQVFRDMSSHRLFLANSALELQSKFSIVHYAGHVEYSAENFIVKNIDNLPPETGKTLVASSNSLLVDICGGGSSIEKLIQPVTPTTPNGATLPQLGIEIPSANVMTSPSGKSTITPTAATANTTTGNKKRRASLIAGPTGSGETTTDARRNPPSFVAQVKTDVSLLTKEVEPTIPHYVRCIKPSDDRAGGLSSASTEETPLIRSTLKKSRSRDNNILFQQFKVSEQLRYSGVLEAIRVQKAGFKSHIPHAEFYSKYRVIASNLVTGTEENEKRKLFRGPEILPKNTPPEEIRDLCQELITLLADPTSKLKQDTTKKALSFYTSPVTSPISKSPNLKAIASMEKIQGYSGLVHGSKIKIGLTLVFMKRKEFETMESLRNICLREFVIKVQSQVRRRQAEQYRKRMMAAARVLVRYGRLFAAKIHLKNLRLRLLATVSLQRRFRKLVFNRKVVSIQCAFRKFQAKKVYNELKERREELLKIYGPMMTSRGMRNRRRRDYEYYMCNDVQHLPQLEIRAKNYREHEIALIKQIFDLINKAELATTNSNSSLASLKPAVDFEKVVAFAKAFVPSIDDESIKIRYEVIVNKLRRAENMVKTAALTETTVVGKLFGRSAWMAFSSFSSEIVVNLSENHGFFVRIVKMIERIVSCKGLMASVIKQREESRQRLRLSSDAHADEKIVDLNKFINIYKKIVSFIFDPLLVYYRTFMTHFITEYGPSSAYRKKFRTNADYVKALLILSEQLKKYQGPDDSAYRQQADREVLRLYNMEQCPLTVFWKDTSDQTNKDMMTLELANKENNDLLKKMALLELSKREFNPDNLRIMSFNNIGYQYMPKSPGIGFAINSLFSLIGGNAIVPRRLIKLTSGLHSKDKKEKDRVAYYQAMAKLTKYSLLDILYNPILVEQIDTSSFTMAVLTACLTGLTNMHPNHISVAYEQSKSVFGNNNNPVSSTSAKLTTTTVDTNNMSAVFSPPMSPSGASSKEGSVSSKQNGGSPSPRPNKLLKKKSGSLRSMRSLRNLNIKPGSDTDAIVKFLAFNNDTTTSTAFLDFENEARDRIHYKNMNTLFFMPHMDEPVDPDIRKFLISTPFKAEEIVATWLRELYEQNERFAELKSAGFKEEDFQALQLPIVLTEGSSLEIYRRLHLICEMLQQPHPYEAELLKQGKHIHHVSLQMVLETIYPELASFYLRARSDTDFQQGSEDFAGVVSYAYAYHSSLDEEKQKLQGHRRKNLPTMASKAAKSSNNSATSSLIGGRSVSKFVGNLDSHSKWLQRYDRYGNMRASGSDIGDSSSNISRASPALSADGGSIHSQGSLDSPRRTPSGDESNRSSSRIDETAEKGHVNEDSKAVQALLASHSTKTRNSKGYEAGIDLPQRPSSINLDVAAPVGSFAPVSPTAASTPTAGQPRSILKKPSSQYLIPQAQSKDSFDAAFDRKINALLDYDKEVDRIPHIEEEEYEDDDDSFKGSPEQQRRNNGRSSEESKGSKVDNFKRNPLQVGFRSQVQRAHHDLDEDDDRPVIRFNRSSDLNESNSSRAASIKFNFDHVYGSFRQDDIDEDEIQFEVNPTAAFRLVQKKVLVRNASQATLRSKESGSNAALSRSGSFHHSRSSMDLHRLQMYDVYAGGNGAAAQTKDGVVFEMNEFRERLLRTRSALHGNNDAEINAALQSLQGLGSTSNGEGEDDEAKEAKAVALAALKLSQRLTPLKSTVENEALGFITALDWRTYVPSDNFSALRAVEFCQSIGKNLSFIPMLWMNYPVEWQLKAVFGYWLRAAARVKDLSKSRARLQVKELILRFDSVEEMDDMKDAPILLKLRRKLKIDIKFAVPTRIAEENEVLRALSQSEEQMENENKDGMDDHEKTEDDEDYDQDLAAIYGGATESKDSGIGEVIEDGDGDVAKDSTNDDAEFDIYSFDNFVEIGRLFDDDDGNDDDDDDTTQEQKDLRKNLLAVVWSCTNLTAPSNSSTPVPGKKITNEQQAAVVQKMEKQISVLKAVILRMTTGPVQDFENELKESFIPILLEYPGLAVIGQFFAECNGFEHHLDVVHRLLAHPFVDRYIDVILQIFRQHPSALWLADSEGYLPCDRVKRLPESKPYKYKLYSRIVNFAGDLPITYMKKYQSKSGQGSSNVGSIVSSFRGEEELIIAAAQYGLYATELELRTKKYNMNKRGFDSTASEDDVQKGKALMDEDLLWRLLISEACGVAQQRDYAWQCYDVYNRVMRERLVAGPPDGMTLQEVEDVIWGGLDLEVKATDRKNYVKLTETALTHSHILKDLKANWPRGGAKKRAFAAAQNSKTVTIAEGEVVTN